MYIYQNGKLYAQLSETELVGVEIYSDKVLQISGTESDLADDYLMLTKREVQCKFQIGEDTPYIFPVEVKSEIVEEKVEEKVVIDEPKVEVAVIEKKTPTKKAVKKTNGTVGKAKGTTARK